MARGVQWLLKEVLKVTWKKEGEWASLDAERERAFDKMQPRGWLRLVG
ncbi:hypothetical protein L195_g043674 [Trifolium pratense]|uniref:Uncharacterized protein n=1 Tax=Trifolium pratense TaxID=57577 RepID=A0A2K3M9X4_TRIPR|nr:hypothetical protein L195_g043674 [Trifolium pratense]